MFRRLDALIFVVCASGLAFAYGVITAEYKVFPYQIVREIKRGLTSWNKLEPDELPVHMGPEVEDLDLIANSVILADGAGSEYLLIASGFYQNLDICPKFGCLARIIDRKGRIVRTWSADPADFVDGIDGLEGSVNDLNIYAVGMSMDTEGNLIVIFQVRNTFPYEVGVASFDKNGKLLWKHYDNTHHWPTVAPNGDILLPAVRMISGDEYEQGSGVGSQCEDVVQSQGVRILGPDGNQKTVFWFDDVIAKGDRPGMLYSVSDPCNPHHVNGIAVVAEAGTRFLQGAKTGDLAVSLRESSSIAIIDRRSGELLEMVSHYTAAQHSPNFIHDGTLIAFDNLGGQDATGGSRIVGIKASLRKSHTIFPPAGYSAHLLPFKSGEAGVTAVSQDGSRILISESRGHRIIEVDANNGKPLWAMENIVNMKPFLETKGRPFKTGYYHFTAQGAYYIPDGHPILKGLSGGAGEAN